jgi:hypothetical protein
MRRGRDHVDHGEDVQQVLAVPGADGRSMPLDPRVAVSVGTVGIRASSWLSSTSSPASALDRNSARSSAAAACLTGSPRRWRYVGR